MINLTSLFTQLAGRTLFVLVLVAALISPVQSVSADADDASDSERLVLTVAPESLPAKAGEHQILSVQVIGPAGMPVLVAEPKTIRLFSSDPRVASVDSEFVIPSGSSFAIATVHISGEAGSVNFTASADGTSTGHAGLEVAEASEASVGTTLTLFPMPVRLIRGAPEPGRAMVAVVDSSGSPVPPTSDIKVNLTSSDEKILSVPDSVTIPAGSPGVFVDVTPGEAGSGQLTAVADGFSSTGIGIDVFEPSDRPSHLVATVVPERWDHSGIGNPLLVVHAVSTEGLVPGYLPCGIIFLASSNPELLAVPGQVDIPCDTDIASIEVPLVSTSMTGYALITVASPGLVSTSTEFNAVNRAPDQLMAWVLPSKPAAGDVQSPVVIVQLVDHEGTPVAAPGPMPITVRTGDIAIEEVVQIRTEESYSAFPYSLIADQRDSADMWMSAAGVSSVPLTWANTEMPVEAVIEFSDQWRYQSEPLTAIVTVSVQGRPLEGAVVTWGVEDGYADVQTSKTDENGQARAEIRSAVLGPVRVAARVTADAIGSLEVMDHFDSVSPGQQFAPNTRLLGLPIDLLAGLVVIVALITVLFDFVRSGHLGPWPIPGKRNRPTRLASGIVSAKGNPGSQPKSNLLRVLAFWSGGDPFPLPDRPIFDQLDSGQLDFVRSEYAIRIESVVGGGDVNDVPVAERDLIADAAAVSALEQLAERQSQDGEVDVSCKTAELALNAASHLNNTRMAAGVDRFDRTRLWVLYSQTLLNAGRYDEALTAAQAASKSADQIGSQAMWNATLVELEDQIRIRAGASQRAA